MIRLIQQDAEMCEAFGGGGEVRGGVWRSLPGSRFAGEVGDPEGGGTLWRWELDL